MNALVCATRDAAIMQSQAWIDAEGLGDVLWYLAKYSHEIGITLDTVAKANLSNY